MVLEPVHCPNCDGIDVIKHGPTAAGKQRDRCQNPASERGAVLLSESIVMQPTHHRSSNKQGNMALNGSSI